MDIKPSDDIKAVLADTEKSSLGSLEECCRKIESLVDALADSDFLWNEKKYIRLDVRVVTRMLTGRATDAREVCVLKSLSRRGCYILSDETIVTPAIDGSLQYREMALIPFEGDMF